MIRPDLLDRPSPLLAELRWFVRLRWLAGLLAVAGTALSVAWTDWTAVHWRILGVGLAILGYNVLLWGLLRRDMPGEGRGRSSLRVLAWVQLLLDLSGLTLIVVWTGGLSSPLLGLFILHMVFASILLPPPAPYLAASVAMLMLGGGLWLGDQWPGDVQDALLASGWATTLALTVHLTDHITRALRRQQETLRGQYDRTQSILDTAVDGILTIDESGLITSVNPAAERIFGYEGSELIGQSIDLLMLEPIRPAAESQPVPARRARILCRGREVQGRRRDGSLFPLDIAVSEVREGDRRHFTGIFRDITNRKQRQAELRALNEELKNQQRALIQQEKMAAVGQVAAGVAHEVSNPLASMDGVLQLAMRQPDRVGPDTFKVLREQVDRISRIVKQMTEFAHPNETGWETVPLNTMVENALEMVRYDRRSRRVEVVEDLSPEVGAVRLIPDAVQQVLVNIILNALDAMEEVESPRLQISTRAEGVECVVEIADNGCGMDEALLGRVFEPFFTTKPVGRGTGLGLSISYSLVERHGGRLTARSDPCEGSVFTITLPRTGPASDSREPVGRGIPSPGNAPG